VKNAVAQVKEKVPLSTFSTDVPCGSFNTSPTILQVIPALKSGGVEIETLEIAGAILTAGGRPIIVSAKGELSNHPRAKGILLKTLPLNTKNPFKMWKNAQLLKKLILEEKVDIVHARSRRPAWSAFKAAKETGRPFITTYHGAYKAGSIFKTFFNSVMSMGDRVIAISPFIEQHIKKIYARFSWFDPSKVRLIPRGIDLKTFDPKNIDPKKVEHLRKKWNIPKESRLILLPGRISKSKGQDTLIEALSFMKRGNYITILLGSALGHENYRDHLLRFASSLGLEGNIRWEPALTDIAPTYQLADVIVCPSHVPEAFGRLIVEAQAMGKPIIATCHGAACDIIEDEKTGWLVPPEDARALAKALNHVLSLSPRKLEAYSKHALKNAQSYSKDTMCSKTIAVYKEVISNPPSAR